MTAQTVGAIIQDLAVPSLLSVESRPLEMSGSFADEAVSIINSTNHLAKTLLSQTFALKCKESLATDEAMAGSSCDEDNGNARRKRELIPSERKDDGYWDKRRKNNEAARRSREKRRANDMVLETRVLGLLDENARLRAELLALKFRFGLVKDPSDVTILPRSSPVCAHPRSNLTQYYQGSTEGLSHLNTQSCASAHRIQPHLLDQGAVCGLRTAEPLLGASNSPVYFHETPDENGRPSPTEERQDCDSRVACVERHRQDSLESLKSLPHKLRFKSPGGSSDGREMSSSSDTRHCGLPVAMVGPNIQVKNNQKVGWDGQLQNLDHYPREESFDGHEKQYHGPSCGCYNSPFLQNSNKCSTEDTNLRSQISCLSQEVAQLKKLFSHQLHSKIS
ncbi:uncharacterized protein [Leuresthes tenuis]|uniref:uncharacterized protein n=1 Tax=Leuresthes tenuis TaxID=355514 RepID=UPI003B507BDB